MNTNYIIYVNMHIYYIIGVDFNGKLHTDSA